MSTMQHETRDAAVWDARAEVDVGVLIATYIARNPAPDVALCVDSLQERGENLVAGGQRRLNDLDARTLRAIDEGVDA